MSRTPQRIGDSPLAAIKNSVTVEEAITSLDEGPWLKAIKEKLKYIENNGVWKKTALLPGKTVIPCKTVFKEKLDDSRNVYGFKERPAADCSSRRKTIPRHLRPLFKLQCW